MTEVEVRHAHLQITVGVPPLEWGIANALKNTLPKF